MRGHLFSGGTEWQTDGDRGHRWRYYRSIPVIYTQKLPSFSFVRCVAGARRLLARSGRMPGGAPKTCKWPSISIKPCKQPGSRPMCWSLFHASPMPLLQYPTVFHVVVWRYLAVWMQMGSALERGFPWKDTWGFVGWGWGWRWGGAEGVRAAVVFDMIRTPYAQPEWYIKQIDRFHAHNTLDAFKIHRLLLDCVSIERFIQHDIVWHQHNSPPPSTDTHTPPLPFWWILVTLIDFILFSLIVLSTPSGFLSVLW